MNDKPKLYSMLEDNSGGFSSSRFMALLWSAGVFLIWAVASLYIIITSAGAAAPAAALLPIPGEVITVMLGFAGMKVVQRFGEKGESQVEKINDDSSTPK